MGSSFKGKTFNPVFDIVVEVNVWQYRQCMISRRRVHRNEDEPLSWEDNKDLRDWY